MTRSSMAMDALNGVFGGRASFDDVVHEVRMAVHTVLLERPRVPCGDPDRLVKVHEREPLGMPIAVVALAMYLGINS